MLTFLRLVGAIAIFFMALLKAPVLGTLVIFGVSEITDALDGPFARKFPYPFDGKFRWWRDKFKPHDGRQAVTNDQAIDLMLGIAVLVYVIVNIDQKIGLAMISVAILGGVITQMFCYGGIIRYTDTASPTSLWAKHRKIAKVILLLRRVIYLAIIITTILMMLFALELDFEWNVIFVMIGSVIGLTLLIVDFERLSEVKADAPGFKKDDLM